MKFPKISALTPAGEDFKPEAVNEGIWLTAAHVTGIEEALAASETAATQAATDLDAANTAKTTAEATVATQKTQIENLTAQVEKLKKEPAGEIVTTAPGSDKQAADNPTTDAKAKYRTSVDDIADQYS